MFLLIRGILLVRVKLETLLWERLSDVNSNLQGTLNNGIMQGRVIIERKAAIVWNSMTVIEIRAAL